MNEPNKQPNETTAGENTPTSASPAQSSSEADTSTPVAQMTPNPQPERQTDPVAETAPTTPAEGTAPQKKRPVWMYLVAGAIVVITILAILFILEKEGRSSTGIFDAYFEQQAAAAVVATVNGTEITGGDLDSSITQFTDVAFAQGVDISNPDIQDEIRQQSLEVLVNTELLLQEAEERGISVERAEAEERLAQIETELGGPEVLATRMEELGMEEAGLLEDIQEEILIERLLNQVFVEAEVSASDEEVEALYTEAGGQEAGIPPLEEVRPQVEAQIIATKEQQAIDEFLAELRNEATIETF